jgi:DNA modification methylase
MSFRKVYPPFTSSWRPVLVFSRSAWNQKGLQIACDTQSIYQARPDDYLCENQQPLAPWQKWLGALTRPGDLVADPFAGVATIGVAIKSVGCRRYLGTERDDKRARLGRGRLAKTREGSYRQGS